MGIYNKHKSLVDSLTKWLLIAHTPGRHVNAECILLRYCFAISNFTVQVHPPVLPPVDAYVPDVRRKPTMIACKKFRSPEFKMDVYFKYLQDHVAPQATLRPILEVTFSHRGRCIRCNRKLIKRLNTAYS
ncbi:hypothetical protein KIN20_010524 [Parelaphostrongylus tenuis]|uniref:Uncharacterized protein n=1 Tax=Parelaphostrongylus tenuis TaxID=148309 RepID=A0AAD5QLF7_PARTN|nr:hypothetical protein KIN20_010524 [Parelaphostrongylus tenuis]